MRLVQASLAAVGAFWSELIPAPSLWDYEGAALADREAAVEVWEPSHADYDDEVSWDVVWRNVECPTCHANAGLACEDVDGYRQPKMPPHDARIELWQWLNPSPSVAVTVPAVAAVPAGVSADPPVLAPPAGLPFTFNADELVSTASELIYNHYRRNGVFLDGAASLAHGAAELVVSQLVADLTAAYTEAQK